MRVIIAGSRTFNAYDFLCQILDVKLHSKTEEIEIVSGGAKGADQLGERYARERGYPIKLFPANWAEYGKMAGPIRNNEMANYSDLLIAFWDGKSSGTKNMIEAAYSHSMKVVVIHY